MIAKAYFQSYFGYEGIHGLKHGLRLLCNENV